MIELACGLSSHQLTSVRELEARTLQSDGGRLKLEWGVLRSRSGRDVEDILWWEEGRLVGFLGLYAFGAPAVELAGMVDPVARRSGVATAMLDAALPLCRERGYRQALLVTPRPSTAGKNFALSRRAVLEHSEHALALTGPPTAGPSEPSITVRTATPADACDVSRLLTAAFGWTPCDVSERITTETSSTLIIDFDGVTVGTVRLTREDDTAGIYGFAVDPDWQARGIGRDVLRRVCRQLREDSVRRIGLEVAVANDHALGLYTSLGFTEVTTEDYYALPI